MYPELNGKVALITGASRGFGRAIALRLVQEGCHIVVNYRRSKTEAEGVYAEILAMGGTATLVRADMGDEDKIKAMFEQIKAEVGRVDIVVPNASFGIPGQAMNATTRYWDVTMDATAKSLLVLAQQAVPLMQNWGRIITVTSYGGQRVLDGYGVVGPAKAAVEGLTRTLAVELAPKNIIVNGVMPGLADTKSFRAIPGADEALARVASNTPAGRVVSPEEVANTVAFLASDQAAMIVGQFIIIDGGAFIVG
ncbi:MAG: SDR family oxidoreductase [Candidatus Margulisiibacteriota bacterium]